MGKEAWRRFSDCTGNLDRSPFGGVLILFGWNTGDTGEGLRDYSHYFFAFLLFCFPLPRLRPQAENVLSVGGHLDRWVRRRGTHILYSFNGNLIIRKHSHYSHKRGFLTSRAEVYLRCELCSSFTLVDRVTACRCHVEESVGLRVVGIMSEVTRARSCNII